MSDTDDEKSPEALVAETMGEELDPLAGAKHDEFASIDVDWFDRYLEKHLPRRGKAKTWEARHADVFGEWKEFMAREHPQREPSLPNHYHVEDWIDELVERMKGETARSYVNIIQTVYQRYAEESAFPHLKEYDPFEVAKSNSEGILGDRQDNKPREWPQLDLDDVREVVHSIKHVGERAATVFGLKSGVRPGELANVRIEEIHLSHPDVLDHYDGSGGQGHGAMGSHPQLADRGRTDAVFIETKHNRPADPDSNRPGNKRKRPSVIPLDLETQQALIDWLLIRPDAGSPYVFVTQKGGQMKPSSLQNVWRKHWWPEYEVASDDPRADSVRSITPHYQRHWMTTWCRTHARMGEPWVQYLRGDSQSSELGTSREAIHRYINTYYEDVEEAYREDIFKLGL